MEELKNELSEVKSRRQTLDLYQYEQTEDLANVTSPNLRRLYETFQMELSSWLSRNTKIALSRKISMSSACYFDTDYLLCHDDNLGDRRIAFILYLSKNWTADDGGTLDLFDTDDIGLPRKVVHSLLPEYNSLIFFEVVANSYHQVAEITSPEKSRWTINGWFHGPPRTRNRPPRPDVELPMFKPSMIEVNLESWMSSTYLHPDIITEIQKGIEKNSYTFLSGFLKPEVYERLTQDVTSEAIRWNRVGPADVRNYEVADEESLPRYLGEFYELFKSIETCKLLKKYTELDLVPDTSSRMNPKMTIELQRWSKGCYTLICDKPARYKARSKKENGDGSYQSLRSRTSSNENEDVENEIFRRILKGKSTQQQASCSRVAGSSSMTSGSKRRTPFNPDSEDSDVSDIGDYLSDPHECSSECSEAEDDQEPGDAQEAEVTEPANAEPGSLDVIMLFNTCRLTDNTIDYVDPTEEEGALIHVPPSDNHLCLVYKNHGVTRLQKYVNHYRKGYYYSLISTYYE